MQKNIKILPSLASADQMRLGEQIRELGEYPYLHLDIEDGNFIPNITFGMKTVRAAAGIFRGEMDAHLMVTDPLEYIDDLAEAGVAAAAFHIEAVQYPYLVLHRIKARGMRAGIAMNFMAPPEAVLPYKDAVDYVLLMTSEPDGENQKFCPHMLQKIEAMRRLLPQRISVAADGGVSEENMGDVIRSGADILVMGRAVWQAGHAGAQLKRLQNRRNGRKIES